MTRRQRAKLIDEMLLSGAIPHVEERGIPIIGRGPSVMPGTDPVRALLAKERREENRRRTRVPVVDMDRVRRLQP